MAEIHNEFKWQGCICNPHRTNPKLIVRGLIIPDQQQDPHSLLGFVLEQFTEGQVASSRQRPRGLPNKLHLVKN